MIISQKCNCCSHNEVCSKKALYEGTCRDIKSILTDSRNELVSVSLNCKYFAENKPTVKNITTNINKI